MTRQLAMLVGAGVLVLVAPVRAQEYKAARLAVGTSFLGDSTAFTFDIAFNQPEADDPSDPHVLWILRPDRGSGVHWYLAPTSSASLGNGTKAASNNVVFQLPFTGQFLLRRAPGRPLDLLNVKISPANLTADRDFNTTLVYASVGADLYRRQWIRLRPDRSFRRLRWGVQVGARVDGGARLNRGAARNGALVRFVPTASFALLWLRYIKLSAKGQFSFLTNDPAFSSSMGLGLLESELTIRFRGKRTHSDEEPSLFPVGLSIKYVLGHDQPTYEKRHVLTIGVALYTM